MEHVEKWKGLIPQIPSILDIKHYFTKVFLARELVYSPFHLADPNNPSSSELTEWFDTLKKDPDLKNFMDKVLSWKEKSMKFEYENFAIWKKWWESAREALHIGMIKFVAK